MVNVSIPYMEHLGCSYNVKPLGLWGLCLSCVVLPLFDGDAVNWVKTLANLVTGMWWMCIRFFPNRKRSPWIRDVMYSRKFR